MKELSYNLNCSANVYKKYVAIFLAFLIMMPVTLLGNNISLNNAGKVPNNLANLNNSASDILWKTFAITKTKNIGLNTLSVVGGDFSLDFVASAPYTYDHTKGGGAFDDRTIGKTKDVVESLEGGDFQCYDIVSFLTKVKVSAEAQNSQKIRLNYSFLAHSTGQQGVALGEFVAAYINDFEDILDENGNTVGDGTNGSDAGHIENGTPNANLDVVEFGLDGPEFKKPTRLRVTADLSGLEAGESIIVRIDVKITCQIPSSPTGNLQADITSASVIEPGNLSKKDASISVGKQTVPFKNVNLIDQGQCALDKDLDKVCEGTTTKYTLTTNGTPSWSLTGNAIFVTSLEDDTPITDNDPGTATEVYVLAIAPINELSEEVLVGSYTLKVDVNSDVTPVQCIDEVDVYATPDKPVVIITEGVNSLCGPPTLPSIEVCSPVEGLIYYLEYGEKVEDAYSKNSTVVNNVDDNPNHPQVIFEDLDAGYGFQIKAINDDDDGSTAFACESGYTNCDDENVVDTCPADEPIDGESFRQSSSSSLKGIGDVSGDNLTAYPVPFSNKATVEFRFEESKKYEVNLYDMRGNLIKQLKSGKAKAGELQQIEVDGQGLPEGMYLVRMVNGKGSQTVKLLKKN